MTFKVPNEIRVRGNGPPGSTDNCGNNGAFQLNHLWIIASDGLGWEHVSVSTEDRTPTWDEMCRVKKLFWDPEDCVIQFHPPKAEYVNKHPHCLHLWREIGVKYDTPPKILTG